MVLFQPSQYNGSAAPTIWTTEHQPPSPRTYFSCLSRFHPPPILYHKGGKWALLYGYKIFRGRRTLWTSDSTSTVYRFPREAFILWAANWVMLSSLSGTINFVIHIFFFFCKGYIMVFVWLSVTNQVKKMFKYHGWYTGCPNSI